MEYFFRYDNVTDYFNVCNGPRKQEIYRLSVTGTEDWCHSPSLEATLERYRKGYPELTAEAKKLSLTLTPFVRTVKGIKKGYKPQRYAGGNFLLDHYIKGYPDICNVLSPIESKRFASIILNNTASASVEPDVMLKRGIAATALVDILEQHGYRVAIKVCYSEQGSKHIAHTIVTLKAFNQTMELDRIAFFLADPSCFRRLYFCFEEKWPVENQQDLIHLIQDITADSYGRPIELAKSEIGEKDIYLGCQSFNNNAWHSLEGTQAWIKETLRRYGIEFNG